MAESSNHAYNRRGPISLILVVAAALPFVGLLGGAKNRPGTVAAQTMRQQQQKQLPQSQALPQTAHSPRAISSVADTSHWKIYRNDAYGFEMKYPADWNFSDDYENNRGKTPSGKKTAKYAGATERLFNLEKDGPKQTPDLLDWEAGATVEVRITGTSAEVQDWGLRSHGSWYLIAQSPEKWVESQDLIGGDRTRILPIHINAFRGALYLAYNLPNLQTPSGEIGGAYRIFPDGRALLVSWERENDLLSNDFSYRKYFLPILSSFRFLD